MTSEAPPKAPPKAPAPKKRPARQRQKLLDWPAIRADYIEGISQGSMRRWPTYEDLATKYECNAVNIRKRGSEERWMDERATFQRRMDEDRRAQRSHELATLAADLDVNALRIARSGMSVTAARLSELGQMAQERTLALQNNGDRATAPPAPDSDEVRTLALSAKDWYDLGVKALGAEPAHRLVVSGDPDAPIEIDIAQRDQRTVGILAILSEAGVLPDDLSAIDVDSSVERGRAVEAGPPTDAENEQVHPDDADDGREQEPEASGLSAA